MVGPCHAVAPVLDRIAAERENELKLVKVNIDQQQELSQRYGVASIPTMILFKDGEPSAAVIGAQPKGAIEAIARPDRRLASSSSSFPARARPGPGFRVSPGAAGWLRLPA